ncbi:U2 small nuclear ribonucleoprotein auxiliary factor 35 kDa subunit-related protein 2 [Monomorium pharaonis]|uniref:U2 small nuclear ribonucleoprotein auxiliary factor 35 kDa subunit-related protein 2 n=1 Tax=Monomorium pharaonis TaxID=307658 RepID=UPI001747A84C|nr:U2 small nuclear ribonucleoprotein auxiliary factor 35 kDa subunit-related protein 2 [Monomorium pharaonis]
MEGSRPQSTKLSHKEWRRIAKRERRRRIRRTIAQERDANEQRLRAALKGNMAYLKFSAEEEQQKKNEKAQEERERAEREKLWLEEERRAHEKWQVLQEQKAKAEQEKLEQEMKVREELETIRIELLKKKEEEQKKREERLRKQEQLEKDINDYIDNGAKTPEALRQIIETQSTKELCPFFTKTGACRFGNACSKNHRKVILSNVILIPGFYSHFSLEHNSAEYDTDVALEYENSETWQHFSEFFEDVTTELESFGKIKVVKCCCNMEVHLRGNMYIEYYTEREAAKAWRNLKGRWYGGKRLHCEFVSLPSWGGAICGITKCPKGSKYCNFLHTFRNPRNKYDIRKPQRPKDKDSNNSRRSEHRSKSKWEESDRDDGEKDRNWRWSETPEIELSYIKDSEMKHHSTKMEQLERLSRDRRQRRNSKSKSPRTKTLSKEHHHLDRKRARNEDQNKKGASDGRSSKKRKKKSEEER